MGGKGHMVNEINALLDYDKKCYLELFGGSAKVLLNKPPHKIEIYNDNDSNLVNLFDVVKNKHDEFIKWFDLKLYSKELYQKYLQELKTTGLQGTDIERAGKFYYLFQSSFNGTIGGGFSYSYIKKPAESFNNNIAKINEIYIRIKNVQILHDDFENVIKNIMKNKTDIMIYADPPYWCTEHYYQSEFTKEDHFKLAEMLNKINASVMVSYYYFQELEKMYPRNKWSYTKIAKTKHSSGYKKRKAAGRRVVDSELRYL
jgi:DNA adenine methylase